MQKLINVTAFRICPYILFLSMANMDNTVKIYILGRIGLVKHCRSRSDCYWSRSSLIRVYNICHSICIFWAHYFIKKRNFFNFRAVKGIIIGVPIFRTFTEFFIQFVSETHLSNKECCSPLIYKMRFFTSSQRRLREFLFSNTHIKHSVMSPQRHVSDRCKTLLNLILFSSRKYMQNKELMFAIIVRNCIKSF